MNLIYFLLLFFFSQALFAVDPVAEPGASSKQYKQPTIPKVPTIGKPVYKKEYRQKKQTGKGWPRTFVPSDKINADSIVSFPADI